jgi:hypothetical protein
MADQPNANEGADPSEDIRKQNPGETTTADLAQRKGTETQGSNPPEDVEDRPNIGTVKSDYPAKDRRGARP